MGRTVRKSEKSDWCQSKKKKLSLNQCNFLSSHLRLEGPFEFFAQVFLFCEMLRRFPVNHNRPGTRMRTGGLRNLSFCQWASARVFLRSSRKAKNLVQFLYSRKHFHNSKYNNFLFGTLPGNIRMYSAFIYLVCSFDRKGREEIKSRTSTVRCWTFCPLI